MPSQFVIKCDNPECGHVFYNDKMVGRCPKCGTMSGKI